MKRLAGLIAFAVVLGGALVAAILSSRGYFAAHNTSQAVRQRVAKREAQKTEQEKFNDRIDQLTRASSFAELEKLGSDLRTSDTRSADGEPQLGFFFAVVADTLRNIEQHKGSDPIEKFFDGWKQYKPDSVTEIAAEARYRVDAAWAARGGGFANTVRSEQWAVFEQQLTKAKLALAEASKIPGAYDPQTASSRIKIGMATGAARDELDKVVDEVIQKYPTYYPAYQSMAVNLMPRWQGSPGEIKQFAEDLSSRLTSPTGCMAYARIALAIAEYDREEFPYHQLSFPKIQQGFEEILRQYPNATRTRKQFCWIAALLKKREVAGKLFSEIGTSWTHAESDYYWGNDTIFAGYRRWADGKGRHPLEKSPLMAAVNAGNLSAVERAVAGGADINEQDPNGHYALIDAIGKEHHDIAMFLINHGADVKVMQGNGFRVPTAAVRANDVEIIEYLLKHGQDINEPLTPTGMTMLHVAALHGEVKSAEFLVKQPGVKIDSRTNVGMTPLHMAAEKNSVEIAKLLRAKGADVNVRSSKQFVPLHQAALTGSVEMTKYLLDEGADPTALSYSGVSPLTTAESNYKEGVVALLREAVNKRK